MSARAWLAAAVVAGTSAAVVIACKEASVRSVVLDMGAGNAGTAGFACTEERGAACDAILECALRNATREGIVGCLLERCTEAGTGDCARVVACLREQRGTPAECYDQVCGGRPPLAARAAAADGGADLHLYVDYVTLGGTPGCRGTELRSWCAAGRCRVSRRTCLAVSLAADVRSSAEAASRAIADAYARGRTLDDDAPDEPIVVRITGIPRSGPCTPEEEDVTSARAPEGAIGCAYSCPTVLTATSGAVTMDFDRLGATCTEADVRTCLTLLDPAAR